MSNSWGRYVCKSIRRKEFTHASGTWKHIQIKLENSPVKDVSTRHGAESNRYTHRRRVCCENSIFIYLCMVYFGLLCEILT